MHDLGSQAYGEHFESLMDEIFAQFFESVEAYQAWKRNELARQLARQVDPQQTPAYRRAEFDTD